MWEEISFRYEFWFLVAFGLACLQLVTDEFFFGGACIGAFLTGLVLIMIDPAMAALVMNWSLPYIMCGVGGLIGATLMRRACRNQQTGPDINEEPYDGDDR